MPNIEQCKGIFFKFKKGEWKNTLDITYEQTKNINILNLYAILKSYILKEEIHGIKEILTISQNEENNTKINTYTRVATSRIKKTDFLDFLEYYDQLIEKDQKYTQTHMFYGFRLIFYEHSTYWKTGDIYPKQPWQQYIMEEIVEKNRKYTENKNTEKKLKKENKLLKLKILKLKRLYRKVF